MKIFIKLMLLAVVGAVVAPMFLKGPDGKPIMDVTDFAPSASSESAYVSASETSSKLTTVYKWKDENGQWHFSDNQAQGSNHETLKYNPNANVIQSLQMPEEPEYAEAMPGGRPLYAANVLTTSSKKKEEDLDLEGLEPEAVKRIKRALASSNNGKGNANANNTDGVSGISLTTIPLSEIPKLIEDAKNVQALLDKRNEQLEEAISKTVR
ncbi:DUF4124 domain-containing protein [Litoribrevibacter albus]|uniref:DUF4124 domain-containing protein n=1 Tax=Litoribrevibacter albus TaxID=1473156 RepID=A0AA37WA97_9GAMM|nr:DUF4124 domain-containing protein [Litoribrevibacter albus]GLQ33566.1 hypothetical protein GCM10007876_40460 [Litoribrevibacter albus]